MKKYKWLKRITAFAFAVFSGLLCFAQPFITAHADETTETVVINYDETKITDDLTQTQIAQFSTYTDKKTRVVSFMEYCYSADETFAENYGLYAYIFNPSKKEIEEIGSYLYLGLTYDDDGTVTGHTKAPLKILDATDDNVLLKAKITNAQTVFYGQAVTCANQFDGERRYDIKDVYLSTESGTILHEDIHKVYYFTGQASNTGNEEDNTLVCQAFDKLLLEPSFANYRTGIDGNKSNFDGYTCDEINTAYFSIPKEYVNQLGLLQKITAEWYEYVTSPIFVTNDKEVHDGLKQYLGCNVTDENGKSLYSLKENPWRVLWEEIEVNNDTGYYGSVRKHFNGKVQDLPTYILQKSWKIEDWAQCVPRMDWLFLREDAESYDEFRVTKEEIENWAKTYFSSINDAVQIFDNEGNYTLYNKHLFTDSIDADRLELLTDKSKKNGHIRQTIDASEDSLIKLREDKNWWDELWHGASYKETGITPIEVFTDGMEFIQKYPNTDEGIELFNTEQYISSYNNGKEVYRFCLESLQNGEYPVLFRFAVTDYYASTARFDKADADFGSPHMSPKDGFVAQETVFLHFDILSLTFRQDGKDTLIPVVMNPVDVFNGVAPNPNEPIGEDDDWDWILERIKQIFTFVLIGVLVALVFALFGPIIIPFIGWCLKGIGKGVVWLVTAPFKLFSKLFKKRKKRK